MRRKVHYVIEPQHLWSNIADMARMQNGELLDTLQNGFKYIENQSFDSSFQGLFSEINLDSDKLGKNYTDRNKRLCTIIQKIAEGIAQFSANIDTLGDAYEYLIGQFAAGSGKKAGEFYTPQQISTILSEIVTLDSQDPKREKEKTRQGFGFCLWFRFALVKCPQANGTAWNRKNLRAGKKYHDVQPCPHEYAAAWCKDSEFEIHHGDSLLNDWDILNETNPAKKMEFDAVVANPPFSYRWEPNEEMGKDFRFKSYGLAPKSAADFAFLLHGFHFLAKKVRWRLFCLMGCCFAEAQRRESEKNF